jgi:nitrite reductase (NADH) small subunit
MTAQKGMAQKSTTQENTLQDKSNKKDKVWQKICHTNDLVKDSGISALLANDQQVAIFNIEKTGNKVFAIGNYDPIGKANVLSRGIVGCVNDEPVIASPLYKQHFSLLTGKCLQDEAHSVDVYSVRIIDDQVELFV